MICSTLFGGKDESLNTTNTTNTTNTLNTTKYKWQLRFLIVLDNDDFHQQNCWFGYSKLDRILQNSHIFPGKLDVFSYMQFQEKIHRYSFLYETEVSPKKNRVYMRLPKEKKYVLIEDYAKEFIYSQLCEINVLFLRLNTENVKINALKQLNAESSPHSYTNSLVGIHPGLDKYIESMGVKDHECVEIRYQLPTCVPYINETKYTYYEKWKPLIQHRMEDGKYYDEYIFVYEQPAFLCEDFLKQLRTLELDIEDKSCGSCDINFKLFFEIFYYTDDMI